MRADQPVIIGRKPEMDIYLSEDMVSRKHARITLSDGKVFLEDLGSTNGTFVNEERVPAKILQEGDRIRIGISAFDLLRTELPIAEGAEAKEHLVRTAAVNASRITKTGVMGQLKALPLPDLLQLFHNSKKTGMLVVRQEKEGQPGGGEAKEGRIYMRQGQVYHAAIEGNPSLSPQKSFSRIVTWNEGEFELLGIDGADFLNEIEEPIEVLLMEALRQYDEIQRLEGLPAVTSVLAAAKPLEPLLCELSKEQLNTFQLIYNHGIFQLVLDHSEDDDAKCSEIVLELIRLGYVFVGLGS